MRLALSSLVLIFAAQSLLAIERTQPCQETTLGPSTAVTVTGQSFNVIADGGSDTEFFPVYSPPLIASLKPSLIVALFLVIPYIAITRLRRRANALVLLHLPRDPVA